MVDIWHPNYSGGRLTRVIGYYIPLVSAVIIRKTKTAYYVTQMLYARLFKMSFSENSTQEKLLSISTVTVGAFKYEICIFFLNLNILSLNFQIVAYFHSQLPQ